MLEQSSSSLSVTLDEGRVLHQTQNKNILCVEAKLTSQMSQKAKALYPLQPYEGRHSRTLHVTLLVRLLQLVRQKSGLMLPN